MLNSLDMLMNSKASNPDGVPMNLVKDAVNFIVKPLAMIFNASLAQQGIFRNIWKLLKNTPIFKSRARNEKNNYRPILFAPFSLYLKKLCVINYLTSFFLIEKKQ